MKKYLAIDIGASSGRHIVGRVENRKIELEEVFRFVNGQVRKDGHDCWDIEKLVASVKEGIDAALAKEPEIELAPHKDEIAFDDFEKVEMRVGKVLSCEKVKKSKKLLKFTLDDGFGERVILSGIAEYYEPEELVGKKLAFVANLAPRKMMGIESQGMILSAESGGKLRVVTVDDEILPGGSLV